MGDDAYVAETQAKMGAIISAPKLTDKLLKKPPFRFLHDIISNFIKSTGLLGGLFTESEANPGKDADKDLKIAILQKVVSVVGAAHGETCPARPFKIIAGAEPEHTNKMLVMLAGLKDLPKEKVDAAVRATNGEAEPAPAPKKEEPKPKKEAPAAAPKAEEAPPSGPPAGMQAGERPSSQGGGRRGRSGAAEQASQPSAAVPAVQALPAQDAAAGGRPGTASARKAPPAVKSNEVEERHESVSKAPVANVISESKGGEEEEEKKDGDQDWMKLVEQEEQAKGNAGGEEGQTRGYLAQQAAQAKKAQEEEKKKAEEEAAAAGRSTGGVVLKTRKRDDKGQGSIGATEMTKLREQLQMLTKASNPLGKFLEALHEDVDTMARELDMWKNEATNQAQAAADARKQTEEALRELNAKQQALEDAVNAKSAQINIVRGTVLQNDKSIDTLVRMVVNPDKQ